MLNKYYDNTLNLILAGDELIKEKILKLIEKMPKEFKENVGHSRSKLELVENNTIWNLFNDGEDLSIFVCDKKNKNRDYISLSLHKIDESKIRLMRSSDFEYIGFVTFFLDNDHRKKQIQLTYDCYIEKYGRDYFVRFKSRINTTSEQYKDLIEKRGYTELTQGIFNKSMRKVNLDEVFNKTAKR